jgi:phosphatidylglycerophosphatase GEP4
MNISGIVNAFKLLRDPSLCLPHHTVSNFNHLPIPLSKAFTARHGEKTPDIRAVILDKDNCFAVPHENEVHKPYQVGRRTSYNEDGNLIRPIGEI